MNFLEYSTEIFDRMTNRPEYIRYSSQNPRLRLDKEHCLNVSKLSGDIWTKKFDIDPPTALEISGLFHDCDRFFPDEIIDTQESAEGYENLKLEHSKKCAKIFEREVPELPKELTSDVSYMIKRHEIGGEKKEGQYIENPDKFTGTYNLNVSTDQLTEADGVSFFSVILPEYVKWASQERVENKIKFSFEKLSPIGQEMVRNIQYNEKIEKLVSPIIGNH